MPLPPIIETLQNFLTSNKWSYIELPLERNENHKGTLVTNFVGEQSNIKVPVSISLTGSYVSVQTHYLITTQNPQYKEEFLKANFRVVAGAWFMQQYPTFYSINMNFSFHYEFLEEELFNYHLDLLCDQSDLKLVELQKAGFAHFRQSIKPGEVISQDSLEAIRLSGGTVINAPVTH